MPRRPGAIQKAHLIQYRDDIFRECCKMITYLRLVLTIPVFLVALACSTTKDPTVANGGDPQLVAQSQTALQQLFATTPKAQELQSKAKAVVVFPEINKAGLVV